MLRGYRGPALAFVMSVILLGAVMITRPPEPPPPGTPAPRVISTVTVRPAVLPTSTPAPTLTPAPTIPFQRIDTATLNEALVAPGCVVKLNPLLAGYNQADRDVSALIFEGLMTTDPYGAAVPGLAAALPRISADGLVYVVTLRDDIRWHDGAPFTSADVAFTVALMQDAAFPGPVELQTFWQTVQVDVIDERTVRFTLAQPLATFLDYLRIGILPEHVLRGTSAAALRAHPFNLSPIGTGPYQFDALLGDGARLRGVRLRLAATYVERPEARDGFSFRQINFRCYPTWEDAIAAFQRGEVNTIGEVPPEAVAQIAALPLIPYAAYRPALGAVIYNWTRDSVAYFRDQRMRRALAYSVDRQALVDRYMADRAVSADGPILPSSWAFARGISCPTYDPAAPDAARQSLAQVQIAPPPTPVPETAEGDEGAPPPEPAPAGPVYAFQLLVANDVGQANVARAITEAWNALGLRVELVVVDRQTFRERLAAGNFDAALVELNLAPMADPDPYSLWRQAPRDGGLNFGGMNDRLLSELVETARRAPNGSYRVELYRQYQQLFCDRSAALILYYPVYYYGADQRIAGIQLGFMSEPADRFRTIHDWRFVAD